MDVPLNPIHARFAFSALLGRKASMQLFLECLDTLDEAKRHRMISDLYLILGACDVPDFRDEDAKDDFDPIGTNLVTDEETMRQQYQAFKKRCRNSPFAVDFFLIHGIVLYVLNKLLDWSSGQKGERAATTMEGFVEFAKDKLAADCLERWKRDAEEKRLNSEAERRQSLELYTEFCNVVAEPLLTD